MPNYPTKLQVNPSCGSLGLMASPTPTIPAITWFFVTDFDH